MDEIEHKFVQVNGVKIHVAEIGGDSSPAVLFLHGFPEIWYSWRHQMVAVAEAGFRAIAPDYRGYGLSDPPPQPEKASFGDFVADLLSLLDALSIQKVFVICKDFGARVGYLFVVLHPERILGVISMGIPYLPPSPVSFTEHLPEGFYIARWREPVGRAEADFARLDTKTVVRNIYILFSRPEIPIAHEKQEVMDIVDSDTPLPPWFSEQDLENYASLYQNSGFQTALKVPYRSMDETFDVKSEKVELPALLIMGEKDYFFKFPGIEDYIKSDRLKALVPKLETVYVPEGSHFVQEQFPQQVNNLILNFLNNNM